MEIKKCPKCNSEECVPIASNWLVADTSLPLWHCNSCRYEWGKDENEIDDAMKIEQYLKEYLSKHPDDKARLMSIIKNF